MKAKLIRIKPLDYLIFFFTLAAIVFLSAQSYIGRRETAQIFISAAGGRWIYPLDGEETLSIAGPLGDTIVEIQGGAVVVLSSPCPEKICVKTGRISKPGQWIACLPNRVFIMIRAKSRGEPDAISQ